MIQSVNFTKAVINFMKDLYVVVLIVSNISSSHHSIMSYNNQNKLKFEVHYTYILESDFLRNLILKEICNMGEVHHVHLRMRPGPTLDKKCVRLLDAAPSNKILRKIYFVVKPFINLSTCHQSRVVKFQMPFFCKNSHFLLISDAAPIF